MRPKQPKHRHVRVRADELAIHPNAQRAIIKAHLKYLTTHMNLDAIGTVHCVRYPINRIEKLWVVDGQHRIQALLDLGFGEWIVDVMLHEDVTDDAGANLLFLELNTRKQQTSFQKYSAAVRAGIPDAVGVANVCAAHRIAVRASTGDRCAACVDKLRRIWNYDLGISLDMTLDVINTAWGSTSDSMEGVIVEGLGMVIHKFGATASHGGLIDYAALTTKLSKYPGGANGLHGQAKARVRYRRSSVARCVYEIIIETYNAGRRGKSRLE